MPVLFPVFLIRLIEWMAREAGGGQLGERVAHR
jgi:hypothetical protein